MPISLRDILYGVGGNNGIEQHLIDVPHAHVDISGKEDVGVAQDLIDALPASSNLTRTKVVFLDTTDGVTEFDTGTTFTSIADVELYLNGFRLIAGSEYIDSATNPGSYITLIAPTVLNDDIEIITWSN